VAVKKAELQAAAWNAVRRSAFLGAGISAQSLLLAGIIARRITRPIESLRSRLRISSHNLPSPLWREPRKTQKPPPTPCAVPKNPPCDCDLQHICPQPIAA